MSADATPTETETTGTPTLSYDSSPEGGALADGGAPAADESAEPEAGAFDVSGGDPPAQDPAVDGQQADGEQGEGEKAGETPTYTDFTLPENYTIRDEDLSVFTELASSLGADQEQAQQLVDLAVGVQQVTLEQVNAKVDQDAADMKAGWKNELRADPDLGGENEAETTKNVHAFERSPFATPELMGLLTESGLLYHTEVARLLSSIGKSLQENPASFTGTTERGVDGDAAQRMFSNSEMS